ncbi:MAG: acetyl-CoA acetyltransferase, partial [Proteobacteria bacterium]|nr:acetyl-CoA acetyltransferase [Pseudomonadota bacterium]
YLAITDVRSWKYDNLPKLLAERLGLHPKKGVMTALGGNMSQWLVNDTASKILEGQVGVALLTGGESYFTARRARFKGTRLAWTKDEGADKPERIGSTRLGINQHEAKYNLTSAIDTYALFENGWRFHHGLSLEAHRARMGKLLSRLTAVAAENPYARFPKFLTPDEITKPTPNNRMICFPYTKWMCANLDVNKSASLIMASVSRARALGIPQDRWVYWWGGGDAEENPWFVSERPDFHSCPAMKFSADKALDAAGLTIQEVDYFDLYSCFHIAVQLAREEMGLGDADERPLTVTGGLPYAGQSGSNCGMDSIVSMIAKLRQTPGTKGMVTGNGWYLTKQATGIFGAEAGEAPPRLFPDREDAPSRQAAELVQDAWEGRGVIETYTVAHDRNGEPNRGLLIGRLEDGRRFIANTPTDRPLLEELMREEAIGRAGRLAFQDERHVFTPDQ